MSGSPLNEMEVATAPFPVSTSPARRLSADGSTGARRSDTSAAAWKFIVPRSKRRVLQWREVRKIAAEFMPRIERYSPIMLEELHGIAAGAEIAVEDVVALNARTELLYGRRRPLTPLIDKLDEGCTGAIALPGATASGNLLHGQNWDWRTQCAESTVVLEYGLDRPMWVQFLVWFQNILSLDFGTSLITRDPVLETILSRFAVTAQMVVPATLLGAAIAVTGGIIAAWRQNAAPDLIITTVATVVLSVPSFWVGMLLIAVFGVKFQLLPTVGYVPLSAGFLAGLTYLLMPTLCLVFIQVGSVARMMRATMIEILRTEYITHARAKGLGEASVLMRHAFKNAVGPTLSWLGLILGALLAGAAVIESVFTLPGLGRLLVDSISSRDYPMVQGVMLFVAAIYIAVNLLVDLLYPLFDPRVRL